MHSRIIALNITTNEDEVYGQMEGCADYVSELDRDNEWALEILEAIGTVDKDALTFRADGVKVYQKLRAAYDEYEKVRARDMMGFLDGMTVYRTAAALRDRCGVYITSDWDGYPVPWLDFLRDLWRYPELMDKTWNITHVFDYHF